MSMDRPTINYFGIYMCAQAQRGVSLHGSEPSNRDILPGLKGQRGTIGRRGQSIHVKSMLYEVAQRCNFSIC